MKNWLIEVETFIKEVADLNYPRFANEKVAVAGHNGPYCFDDTPVRNTAHWAIIYLYLWKVNKEEKYLCIASSLLDYLINEHQKTKSGAVKCIVKGDFDSINGLIGQAWVIEAFVYAYKVIKDTKFLDIAFKIYKTQIFDYDKCLWKRVDIDGEMRGYDYTLNHQVWFAAVALMMVKERNDDNIVKEIECFLTKLSNSYFDIYPSGLTKHYGTLKKPNNRSGVFYIKRFIKDLCVPLRRYNPNKYDSKTQEIGYHLFELYGFAMIKQYRESYDLFEKEAFKKAASYGNDIDRLNCKFNIAPVLNGCKSPLLRMNRFAYGYNSPAFEYPFFQYVIYGRFDPDKAKELLNIQKRLTYDEVSGVLSKNNYDPETLTARIYEYIRLCELIRSDNMEGRV